MGNKASRIKGPNPEPNEPGDTSQTSAVFNFWLRGLFHRRPSTHSGINPSALVGHVSSSIGATINFAASIIIRGYKIHYGIDKAIQKIKINAENVIEVAKKMSKQELLRLMVELIKKKSKELTQWCKDNPWKATFIALAILATIFGIAAPAMLSVVGFSAAGPIAGSIAAGWQASIGSVAVGSLFALLQSAAMGGFGVAIVSLVGASIPFVLGAVLATARWYKRQREANGNSGSRIEDTNGE